MLKKNLLECDIAIIGSGIVGLSSAASILEKDPSKRVIVFERGLLPTGATTKNAGILSIGNFIDILDDVESIGVAKAQEKIKHQLAGIKKLLSRIGTEGADYELYGTHELIGDKELHLLKKVDYVNEILFPIFKENVFSIENQKIKELGVNEKHVKAIIFSKFDAQIDSGKTVKSLLEYTRKLGAIILTGAEVLEYNKTSTGINLSIKTPFSKKEGEIITFKSKKLIIATNAFSNPILKTKVDLIPARGQVFVTKPIPGLKIRGPFHWEDGYYYGRNIGDRILIGGARNTDKPGETTENFETTEKIISRVKEILQEIVLPNQKFELEHKWAGIMGFGKTERQNYRRG